VGARYFGRPEYPAAVRNASASNTLPSNMTNRVWRRSVMFLDGSTAPLFDGGTLWFKRRAALDSYRQAMALYRQTVLGAFAQVADSLGALDHDAQSLMAEDEALAAAEQALRLIQANYEAGLATYLDVLYADTQYHQATIADIQANAVRYQDTVALFAALGAGGGMSSEGTSSLARRQATFAPATPAIGGKDHIQIRALICAQFCNSREECFGIDRLTQKTALWNGCLYDSHHRLQIATH
jgi:hypothetical protein